MKPTKPIRVQWLGGLNDGPLGEAAAFNWEVDNPLEGRSRSVELKVVPMPADARNPHHFIRRLALGCTLVASVLLLWWGVSDWQRVTARVKVLLPVTSVCLWVLLKLIQRVDQNALRWHVSNCLAHQAHAMAEFKPDLVVGWSFGASVACFALAAKLYKGPLLLLSPTMSLVTRSTHGGDFMIPDDVDVTGCRVLVVHGAHDRACPVKHSEQFVERHKDRLPVELLTLPDALHMLVEEEDHGGVAGWVHRVWNMAGAPPPEPAPAKPTSGDTPAATPAAAGGSSGGAAARAPGDSPATAAEVPTDAAPSSSGGGSSTIRRRRRRRE